MTRWVVEISDLVTGTLVVNGVRYMAGRRITEDPAVVRLIERKDPKLYSVTELEDEVEAGPEGAYEADSSPGPGPLTLTDIRAPVQGKRACAECGVEFRDLEQHRQLSGHDVYQEGE